LFAEELRVSCWLAIGRTGCVASSWFGRIL
jgi:hypothetical protein